VVDRAKLFRITAADEDLAVAVVLETAAIGGLDISRVLDEEPGGWVPTGCRFFVCQIEARKLVTVQQKY
jgi:hypothetical protein